VEFGDGLGVGLGVSSGLRLGVGLGVGFGVGFGVGLAVGGGVGTESRGPHSKSPMNSWSAPIHGHKICLFRQLQDPHNPETGHFGSHLPLRLA